MAKENIVYIFNKMIQVVQIKRGSKPSLSKVFTYPIAEELVNNGIIFNDELLTEELKKIKSEIGNNVTILIGSRKVVAKEMTLPIMGHAQVMAFIKNELMEEQKDQYVYDYSVLESKNASNHGVVLAVAIEKTLIQNYITVFEAAGFTIKRINITVNAMQTTLMTLPSLTSKTVVLALVEKNNLSLVLFDKTHYIYLSRTILMDREDEMKTIDEISSALSKLVQANAVRTNSSTIDQVLFSGITNSDRLFEQLTQQFNFEVSVFPVDEFIKIDSSLLNEKLDDYLIPLSCAVGK